jgi:plastocyanin
MFQRLLAALPGRRTRTARGAAVILLSGALAALWLVPTSAASQSASSVAAADQVLTWTAGDSMTDYNTAPTEATVGAATIVFENSTATGNMSGMSHTLTFDTSTPGYNHDVDVNIVASPYDSDGGRHEVEVNLTPGKYRYFCSIPGHGEMVGEFVVTDGGGDTTAPEVSAEVTGDQDADGNYIGSATVAVSASDADSGIDTVEYEIDDTGFQAYTEPVTVTEPGDHAVQYRATDTAGNISETGSVPFRIVEPAPEVSAEVTGDQDADGNYIGSATVTVDASDAGSGIDTVEYEIDDTGFQAYTGPVTVDEPGDHSVQYRATDNSGNVSEIGSVIFAIAEPGPDDTTAPEVSAEITGDQDADGNYIGSATIAISASDADSGIDTVHIAIDGGAYAPYTEPVVVTAPGAHTVNYRATDNSGNTSEIGSVTFTVAEPAPDDTTAPEVSAEITGDQDADGNYIGSATVTLDASDEGSGVFALRYSLDGGSFTPYNEPLVITEPGEHTVLYRATDNSGNASEDGSVTFSVIASDSDACPGSDIRDTVIIGDNDSTVANVDTGDGCTINDLIDEDGEYANHGKFVKHVRQVTDALVADGIISDQEKGRIMNAAARSDVGKK